MFILQLAIILLASSIAGSLSVRLGQPSVLGTLLIGIVLGPSLLGLVNETETLKQFSQIGVLLLMFIAGMETDMDEFKRNAKASIFVGVSGIMVPLVFGYAAGILIHLNMLESWFLGLLLSATSVSISVQALREMNWLKTQEGASILGAAVIDDVVVIIALVFLMSFAGGEANLTSVLVTKVLFFTGAILAGWKVLPWLLKRFLSLKVGKTAISSALIICLIFACFAEYSGVAGIIGAYIAGLAMSGTDFKNEISEKIEIISYSIFVPIFFTSIGITAQFSGITKNLQLVVFLSMLAILTKLIGAAIGAKAAGFGWKSSLGIGSAMVSRGEVALIMASIGLDSQLFDQDLFAILVTVILITTIVTPPMMKWLFKANGPPKNSVGR